MTIDRDARNARVPDHLVHAALWHLIDGMGGAVTIPDFKKLPASKYVVMFEDRDGVELVSQDERPK